MHTGTIANLPQISQIDSFRDTVDYEYESGIDVYDIKQGPATTVYSVTSGTTTFVENTDYNLIEDSDGNFTKIDWSIGGSSPSDGDIFTIDQEFRAVLARYLESHDIEFEDLGDDIVDVIAARQVSNASGDDLDRIGAIFGQLGKRQNRSDDAYRGFLTSIINSFNGRGSRSGLKFAVAAAVNGVPSDVTIVEDVQNLSYSLRIRNVDNDFDTAFLDQLAELADPSTVELGDVVIIFEGNTLAIEKDESTVTDSSTGLGSQTLTLDGNSTLQ